MKSHLLFLAFYLFAMPVLAQNDDISNGYIPGHRYSLDSIDTIDLASGNLMLNIPLLSFKQQDPVSIDYSLSYSGRHLVDADTDQEFGSATGWIWIDPLSSYIPQQGVSPTYFSGVHLSSNQDYRITNTSNYFGQTYPEIISPDGARHIIMPTTQGDARSIDSTGFKLYDVINWTWPDGPLVHVLDSVGVAHTVWSNDIIQGTPNSQVPLYLNRGLTNLPVVQFDSEGLPSEILDAAGRQLPWPDIASGSIGVETADYSKCKDGALPVNASTGHAYVVTFPNGVYYFCYVAIAVHTNFVSQMSGGAVYDPDLIQTRQFLQSVYLPNGREWLFEYNDRDAADAPDINYGSLTKVTLPTGGTIQYTYEMSPQSSPFDNGPNYLNRRVATKTKSDPTVPGSPLSKWIYSIQVGQSPAETGGNIRSDEGTYTLYNYDDTLVTVANPDGTREVHSFHQDDGVQAQYEDATTVLDPDGNTISSHQYSYAVTGYPLIVTATSDGSKAFIGGQFSYALLYDWTLLNDGKQSLRALQYDNHNPGFVEYPGGPQAFASLTSMGKVVDEKVYDFDYPQNGSFPAPSTPIIKENTTTYQFLVDNTTLQLNLLDSVAQSSVLDGQAHTVSQTANTYSDIAIGTYGGVPTSIETLSSTSEMIDGTNLSNTSFGYDQYGVLTSITDQNRNQATLTYDANDIYRTGVIFPAVNGHSGSITAVYNPMGRLLSTTDENHNITSFTYDSLLRPVQVTPGDVNVSGTATYCSADDVNQHCSDTDTYDNATTAYLSVKKSATDAVKRKQTFDGFGRQIHTAYRDAAGWIATDTSYDNMGRVASRSTPYREGTIPSAMTTTSYSYTAAGVTTTRETIDSTGATISQTSSLAANNCVDYFDGDGHHSKGCLDALGRVRDVWEPDASNNPTIHTMYAFNSLDKVVSITQSGNGSETPRVRSFSYDGLGRLLASLNPEQGQTNDPCAGVSGSWSVCYQYDPAGNVVKRTDARGFYIQMTYDARNRLLTRQAYTPAGILDINTPSSCFQYDYAPNNGPSPNGLGRLTASWTQAGVCAAKLDFATNMFTSHVIAQGGWAYDTAGRVTHDSHCVLGMCATAGTRSYDLVGNLTQYVNGYQSVTRIFDPASHLTGIQGIYQVNTSEPFGPTSVDIGTQMRDSMSYDSIGRLIGETTVIKQ